MGHVKNQKLIAQLQSSGSAFSMQMKANFAIDQLQIEKREQKRID